MNVVSKAGVRIADTYDFVLATPTPDRVQDSLVIKGIDTRPFEANPVALYMHNHQEPIGAWSNLKKSDAMLTGRLNFAAEGTSKMVDFARSMVSQGMLKAVSVSFIPVERMATKDGRGSIITKSELLEVSLVTIPMNPQALMIAKSFSFSDDEINSLFEPTNPDANSGHNLHARIVLMKARAGLYR